VMNQSRGMAVLLVAGKWLFFLPSPSDANI
jgi:hypothetical protein